MRDLIHVKFVIKLSVDRIIFVITDISIPRKNLSNAMNVAKVSVKTGLWLSTESFTWKIHHTNVIPVVKVLTREAT